MLLLLNYIYLNSKHKLQLQDALKKIHSYSSKAPNFIKPLKTIVWYLYEAAQLANTIKKSNTRSRQFHEFQTPFVACFCSFPFSPFFPVSCAISQSPITVKLTTNFIFHCLHLLPSSYLMLFQSQDNLVLHTVLPHGTVPAL